MFKIKKDNSLPVIKKTLMGGDDNPVDITGATVTFFMSDTDGTILATGPCVIVDPLVGLVQYEWSVADTAKAGIFRAEFKVEYSPGKVETFPNEGYEQVVITADLEI